jgi:hypothetical protein
MTRFASSDAGSACCASADNAPIRLTRTSSSVRASHSVISAKRLHLCLLRNLHTERQRATRPDGADAS